MGATASCPASRRNPRHMVAQLHVEFLTVFAGPRPSLRGNGLFPAVVAPGLFRLRQDPTDHGQFVRLDPYIGKGRSKDLRRGPVEWTDIVFESLIQRVVAAGEADERFVPRRFPDAAGIKAVFPGCHVPADAIPDPRRRVSHFAWVFRHAAPPRLFVNAAPHRRFHNDELEKIDSPLPRTLPHRAAQPGDEGPSGNAAGRKEKEKAC